MTAKKTKKPNTMMAAIVSAKQYKAKTKKRAKKIEPVKAWAILTEGGQVPRDAFGMAVYAFKRHAKVFQDALAPGASRIVRLTGQKAQADG